MAARLKTNGCYDIESLLEFCGVSKQKIQIDDNVDESLSKIPSLTFSSGVTIEGLQTIATYIARVYSTDDRLCSNSLLGETPLERAEVHEWLEYRQNDVEQAVLSDRSTSNPVLQVV
ncbi:hypothetical protein QZH41_009965 [Actinostola sp. cb2023]|nr:hypothetical protein QZH41_009965 [Actinostola sp. cb2023]